MVAGPLSKGRVFNENNNNMTHNQILGAHIRQSRVVRAIRFNDLATASGLSRGALSKLERGLGNPTVNTLVKLSRALNVVFTINGIATKPRPEKGAK